MPDVAKILRALDVLGGGSKGAMTMGSDFKEVCSTACAALNKELRELEETHETEPMSS